MGTGGRPGKFPAKLVAVSKGLVTLDASAEDTEYLIPFEGQAVLVDITPAGGEHHSGVEGESSKNS